MKFSIPNKRHNPIYPTLFIVLAAFLTSLQGCMPNKKSGKEVNQNRDDTIRIVTEVMDFQTVDTLTAGWHTFLYANKSTETHFFEFEKYPEGKTMKDMEKEVIPSFKKGMDLINEGKKEEGFEVFKQLPSWFFNVVFSGGSGLNSPGHTTRTTIKLQPGYYVIECYVKNASGVFHSALGMVKRMIVTNDSNSYAPPQPDVRISISSEDGFAFNPDEITTGRQTFAVYFKDQKAYGNFVGHDVNLVKLDDQADLDELEKWMDWVDPKGLITPAPEGVTFLGGVNDMPGGRTGYFTVNLDPGRYALIAEVPNSSEKGLLKTFEITD